MPATKNLSVVDAVARLKSNDSMLTGLDLSNKVIGDSGAIAIAVALQRNTVLVELHMGNAHIGWSGAATLASMLKVNETLKKLYLESNDIGDKGATALAEACQVNGTLQVLNLSRNEIGDSGAIALADGLSKNKKIRTLYLYDNTIADAGAAAICELLVHTDNTALQELFLWDNKFGETGRMQLDAAAAMANQAGRKLKVQTTFETESNSLLKYNNYNNEKSSSSKKRDSKSSKSSSKSNGIRENKNDNDHTDFGYDAAPPPALSRSKSSDGCGEFMPHRQSSPVKSNDRLRRRQSISTSMAGQEIRRDLFDHNTGGADSGGRRSAGGRAARRTSVGPGGTGAAAGFGCLPLAPKNHRAADKIEPPKKPLLLKKPSFGEQEDDSKKKTTKGKLIDIQSLDDEEPDVVEKSERSKSERTAASTPTDQQPRASSSSTDLPSSGLKALGQSIAVWDGGVNFDDLWETDLDALREAPTASSNFEDEEVVSICDTDDDDDDHNDDHNEKRRTKQQSTTENNHGSPVQGKKKGSDRGLRSNGTTSSERSNRSEGKGSDRTSRSSSERLPSPRRVGEKGKSSRHVLNNGIESKPKGSSKDLRPDAKPEEGDASKRRGGSKHLRTDAKKSSSRSSVQDEKSGHRRDEKSGHRRDEKSGHRRDEKKSGHSRADDHHHEKSGHSRGDSEKSGHSRRESPDKKSPTSGGGTTTNEFHWKREKIPRPNPTIKTAGGEPKKRSSEENVSPGRSTRKNGESSSSRSRISRGDSGVSTRKESSKSSSSRKESSSSSKSPRKEKKSSNRMPEPEVVAYAELDFTTGVAKITTESAAPVDYGYGDPYRAPDPVPPPVLEEQPPPKPQSNKRERRKSCAYAEFDLTSGGVKITDESSHSQIDYGYADKPLATAANAAAADEGSGTDFNMPGSDHRPKTLKERNHSVDGDEPMQGKRGSRRRMSVGNIVAASAIITNTFASSTSKKPSRRQSVSVLGGGGGAAMEGHGSSFEHHKRTSRTSSASRSFDDLPTSISSDSFRPPRQRRCSVSGDYGLSSKVQDVKGMVSDLASNIADIKAWDPRKLLKGKPTASSSTTLLTSKSNDESGTAAAAADGSSNNDYGYGRCAAPSERQLESMLDDSSSNMLAFVKTASSSSDDWGIKNSGAGGAITKRLMAISRRGSVS